MNEIIKKYIHLDSEGTVYLIFKPCLFDHSRFFRVIQLEMKRIDGARLKILVISVQNHPDI